MIQLLWDFDKGLFMEPLSEELIAADVLLESLNLLVREEWKAEQLKESNVCRREIEEQNAN